MPIAPAPTEAPKRRPRFSLLNLLLLMTIVVMGIVVTRMHSEFGPLKEENRRMKEERGMLAIEDESLLHAIRVPSEFTAQDGETFRVSVPSGKRFFLYCTIGTTPHTGLPNVRRAFVNNDGDVQTYSSNRSTCLPLPEGEQLVSLTMSSPASEISEEFDADRGKVVIGVRKPDQTHFISGTIRSNRCWPGIVSHLEHYGIVSIQELGLRTHVAAPGERLVLLRRQIVSQSFEDALLEKPLPKPTPETPEGIMLWIEPWNNPSEQE